MKLYSRNILSLIFLILISCTATKMGKKEEVISLEQSYMANFKEEPLKDWESGKMFICVTEEFPSLLEENLQNISNPENSGIKGEIFKYKGLKEEQTWSGVQTFLLYEYANQEYKYKVSKPLSDILNSEFKPLLPELVSLDYIQKADSLLKGKELYIKTPNWYNKDGVETKGQKYVPITIVEVSAGNKIFPLSIKFKTMGGDEYSVYTTMYKPLTTSQYSTFDKIFTFTNPKNKYPQIKDEIWQYITQSKVALGMTKDECKISIGLPNKVNQLPEYSGLRERWYYNTGTYLEFKDGLLVNFRQM